MNYYLDVLKKYAVFSGRASRAEYWYFVLFNLLISIALGVVSYGIGDASNMFGGLYSLAVFLPSLAVGIRRLHDTNRSGWWLLIALVPVIGFIVLLIFMIMDSDAGQNQYGPNPKNVDKS